MGSVSGVSAFENEVDKHTHWTNMWFRGVIHCIPCIPCIPFRGENVGKIVEILRVFTNFGFFAYHSTDISKYLEFAYHWIFNELRACSDNKLKIWTPFFQQQLIYCIQNQRRACCSLSNKFVLWCSPFAGARRKHHTLQASRAACRTGLGNGFFLSTGNRKKINIFYEKTHIKQILFTEIQTLRREP